MSAKRNRDRGKEAERAVAKLLQGRRVGLFGGEDVEHEVYSIEVKSREKCVVDGWFAQCQKNCPPNKIPLLVVHLKNKPYENDFVIMKMKDFINK